MNTNPLTQKLLSITTADQLSQHLHTICDEIISKTDHILTTTDATAPYIDQSSLHDLLNLLRHHHLDNIHAGVLYDMHAHHLNIDTEYISNIVHIIDYLHDLYALCDVGHLVDRESLISDITTIINNIKNIIS